MRSRMRNSIALNQFISSKLQVCYIVSEFGITRLVTQNEMILFKRKYMNLNHRNTLNWEKYNLFQFRTVLSIVDLIVIVMWSIESL